MFHWKERSMGSCLTCMSFLSVIASKTFINSRMTIFDKWFALHLWKCQIKFQNSRQVFGYWVKRTMGQDFNYITKFDWCYVIFFWKLELFFLSHYEPNVKVSYATKLGASFPLNKLLLQRTNERVFQLSCSVNWTYFSSTKALPLELISSSSSLSEASSIISSHLLLEDEYFQRLENKVVLGGNYNLFFLGCRSVWWTWIFLLLLPFVVEDTFGCRDTKFRNVSASDISPISGVCVNLLASIRMLLFLAVVECQSRLDGRTYRVWSYLG